MWSSFNCVVTDGCPHTAEICISRQGQHAVPVDPRGCWKRMPSLADTDKDSSLFQWAPGNAGSECPLSPADSSKQTVKAVQLLFLAKPRMPRQSCPLSVLSLPMTIDVVIPQMPRLSGC